MARPPIRSTIKGIAPVRPGGWRPSGPEARIRLSSNENVLGCSPAARWAFLRSSDGVNLYPDWRSDRLRRALAARYGLDVERIVVGSGSTELLQTVSCVFVEPGCSIVQSQYAFKSYAVGAQASGGGVVTVPETDYRVDVEALAKGVTAGTRIVFLANPGNPTGTWVSGQEIRQLWERIPDTVLLVIDAAYAGLHSETELEPLLLFAAERENVFVTSTFSKVHGLAALRVGWGYGSVELAAAFDLVRPPCNVSAAAQAAAVAALEDVVFEDKYRSLINHWRPWLAEQFGQLGLRVVQSAANFVLVEFPERGQLRPFEALQELWSRGYAVRELEAYGLPNHLRVTIGREEHNRSIVRALKALKVKCV